MDKDKSFGLAFDKCNCDNLKNCKANEGNTK